MILYEQLQDLEDTYAACLIYEADAKTLAMLWNQIKKMREEMGLTIHYILDKEETCL